MERMFAKATVIINLCSLEKVNLNSLMQKSIKKLNQNNCNLVCGRFA